MKKRTNHIFIAFWLNLIFSIIELFGGLLTNSIAIITDSIHDFGDALSIGFSFILSKKALRKPNKNFTYGYLRYSVFGALITATILLIGSIFVLIGAIPRLFHPEVINYKGMFLLAIIGVIINLAATIITSRSKDVNEKVVNLHMLEDVLGWSAVLVGSIIIRLFGFYQIDAILSIGIAIFLFINVIKNYRKIFEILSEKTPEGIDISELKKSLKTKDVEDIHHLHVWTLDGLNNYATLHVLVSEKTLAIDLEKIKAEMKEKLCKQNICHSVVEFETKKCEESDCQISTKEEDTFSHSH